MGFTINIDEKSQKYFAKLGFTITLGEYFIGDEIEIELPSYGSADFTLPFKLGAFSYVDSKSIGNIEIGRYCSIAANINISPYQNHPLNWLSTSPFQFRENIFNWNRAMGKDMIDLQEYLPELPKSYIGNDVWIGTGVFIKNGIKIGNGVIIGAGAIVTKDVPPYAIVGGNPARIIRYRFSEDIIERLLALQWWDYAFTDWRKVDYSNIEKALEQIEEAVAEGKVQPYRPNILTSKDFKRFKVVSKRKKSILHIFKR